MDQIIDESAGSDAGKITPASRVRMQFNLRQLLLSMVVLSVAFAVLFAFPSWLASVLLGIAAILQLVALTTCVVYGRGAIRAFCLGALFPAVLFAIPAAISFAVVPFAASRNGYGQIPRNLDAMAGGLRLATVAGAFLAIAAGALSWGLWRYLTQRRTRD